MTAGIGDSEVIAKMGVELVAPAVLYMVSEQCQDSGMIINAGGGNYSRSAVISDKVIKADNPTAEFIAENWQKLTSLEGNIFTGMTEFMPDSMG